MQVMPIGRTTRNQGRLERWNESHMLHVDRRYMHAATIEGACLGTKPAIGPRSCEEREEGGGEEERQRAGRAGGVE